MRPFPRVRCDACDRAWYGAEVAHGLRLIGSCPRCGGSLEFLVDDEPEQAVSVPDLAPAAVLGTPTSWAR
jgi:hypothetical protein